MDSYRLQKHCLVRYWVSPMPYLKEPFGERGCHPTGVLWVYKIAKLLEFHCLLLSVEVTISIFKDSGVRR